MAGQIDADAAVNITNTVVGWIIGIVTAIALATKLYINLRRDIDAHSELIKWHDERMKTFESEMKEVREERVTYRHLEQLQNNLLREMYLLQGKVYEETQHGERRGKPR